MKKTSKLEEEFLFQIKAVGLPEPQREFRFDPTRRWRADMAWQDRRLLVEVEGGIFSRGRHIRPMGYSRDAEKYNQAQMLGYMVLRFTPDMIRNGSAITVLEKAFEIRRIRWINQKKKRNTKSQK